MPTSVARSARKPVSAAATKPRNRSSSSCATRDPGACAADIWASLSMFLACYPAGTVRLVEARLLEGPTVYRLEPVVKLEVAIGRRRTWYGQREPGRHALVWLGASVPARDWPQPVADITAWVRRLRASHETSRA